MGVPGYPELLQRLTADADWMLKLGTIYTAQPIDVLSTVQRLRMRANSSNSRPVSVVATGLAQAN